MLGLGKFFEQRSSFFAYALRDIYQIAFDYINTTYANDVIMQQLLAIDYYLQHKIKPAENYVTEIIKKEKFELLKQLGLPHQKLRYTVIPISFDYAVFVEQGIIENANINLVIEYTGTQKPRVIDINTNKNISPDLKANTLLL